MMNNKTVKTINSKRILKNTILLYVRMLIIMLISLYTSRIVLLTLGITDYGVYNIVASIIVLFSFLSSALTQATQRFLTCELGKREYGFNEVFNSSLNVYFIFSFLIIVLGESVGLWFLNYELNIPHDRLYAANWVFQFSILTFIFGILKTPFNATIISHERMSFYAYVSIIEVFLKLIMVYLLVYIDFDKLIVYSILIAFLSLLVLIVYFIYCLNAFNECRLMFIWDKKLLKKLLSFSSWSMLSIRSLLHHRKC